MKIFSAVTLTISALCFCFKSSFSFPDVAATEPFPLPPRASVLGLIGSNPLVSGDILLPLAGNNHTIFFLDGQAKTAFDTPWLASLGPGFRFMPSDQQILGAYVFVDRSVADNNNSFWFISPGIESLGRNWDFRANGYAPISSTRVLQSTGFADQFGNYNYVQFQGHNQFDALVNNYKEVGWGADVELGRRIPFFKNMHVFLGGYHFDFEHASVINGISGRLEYPINSLITLNVRNTYDNEQHDTIEAGLQFTLGGVNHFPQDPDQPVSARIEDPIPRFMATLDKGNGEPVVNAQEVISSTPVLERTDIWFFSPNGTAFINAASCTSTNPCASFAFNQETINQINGISTNPSFYFRTGGYSALNNGLPDVLTNDSLYSRTEDYRAPQRGAIVTGAFDIYGKSNFDSITLLNDENFTQVYALYVTPSAQLNFANSVIGPANNAPLQAYATGIQMQDSTLTANNHSEIYAYSSTHAAGIKAIDNTGSHITVDDSKLIATVLGLTNNVNYSAAGIATLNQSGASGTTSDVQVHDSTVNANAIGNFGIFTISGISSAEDSNHTSINHSDVGANATITYGNAFNMSGVSLAGFNNALQVSNGSNISAQANTTVGSIYTATFFNASGIQMIGNNNSIQVHGSVIDADIKAETAQQTTAQGIDVEEQGAAHTQINISDSEVFSDALIKTLTSGSELYSIISQGVFINTDGATAGTVNSVNVDSTTISANGNVQNINVSGFHNNVLADGILIGSNNNLPAIDDMQNSISITGSTVLSQALITAASMNDPYNLYAKGIDVNSGNNSTNMITINDSFIQSNSVITTGPSNYATIQAYGIESTTGDNSSNIINVANQSTVSANASVIISGDLSEQVTAYGIHSNAGANSTNNITIGTAGNNSDTTQVNANAIIDNATGSSDNTAISYGMYVNSSSTNQITIQGASQITGNSQITNNTSSGNNEAKAWGIYTNGNDNTTILKDTSTILANSYVTGASTLSQAIGIESTATSSNIFNNIADPTNNNITATQNGVDDGQKVILSYFGINFFKNL